jgi:hypothetical protein
MNRLGGSIPLIGGSFCLGQTSTREGIGAHPAEPGASATDGYQLPEEGQAPLLVVLQVRVAAPLPDLLIVKLLPEADLATTR